MTDLDVKAIVSDYFDVAYASLEDIYQDEPLSFWRVGLWKKDINYTYNFYLELRIFPDQINIADGDGNILVSISSEQVNSYWIDKNTLKRGLKHIRLEFLVICQEMVSICKKKEDC